MEFVKRTIGKIKESFQVQKNKIIRTVALSVVCLLPLSVDGSSKATVHEKSKDHIEITDSKDSYVSLSHVLFEAFQSLDKENGSLSRKERRLYNNFWKNSSENKREKESMNKESLAESFIGKKVSHDLAGDIHKFVLDEFSQKHWKKGNHIRNSTKWEKKKSCQKILNFIEEKLDEYSKEQKQVQIKQEQETFIELYSRKFKKAEEKRKKEDSLIRVLKERKEKEDSLKIERKSEEMKELKKKYDGLNYSEVASVPVEVFMKTSVDTYKHEVKKIDIPNISKKGLQVMRLVDFFPEDVIYIKIKNGPYAKRSIVNSRIGYYTSEGEYVKLLTRDFEAKIPSQEEITALEKTNFVSLSSPTKDQEVQGTLRYYNYLRNFDFKNPLRNGLSRQDVFGKYTNSSYSKGVVKTAEKEVMVVRTKHNTKVLQQTYRWVDIIGSENTFVKINGRVCKRSILPKILFLKDSLGKKQSVSIQREGYYTKDGVYKVMKDLCFIEKIPTSEYSKFESEFKKIPDITEAQREIAQQDYRIYLLIKDKELLRGGKKEILTARPKQDSTIRGVELAQDQKFRKKLLETSLHSGIAPSEYFKIMYAESRLDPHAKNPFSTATGLIQWLNASAIECGLKGSKDLKSISGVEQLKYVRTYMQQYISHIKSIKDQAIGFYIAVFWPKMFHYKNKNFPIGYERSKKFAQAVAKRNKAISDLDGDGIAKTYITTNDFIKYAKVVFDRYGPMYEIFLTELLDEQYKFRQKKNKYVAYNKKQGRRKI